jgi:hypothetical protein
MKTLKLKDHPKLKEAHEFVTNFPDAIIAGGVARDILLDKEYDDIDIFVPDPLVTKAAYRLYGATFNISKDKASALDIKILPRSEMLSVEGLIEQFDLVMNQAWLEPCWGGFEVYSTDLFDSLYEAGLFGYYPNRVTLSSEHVKSVYNSFKDEYELLALVNGVKPIEGVAHAS